MPAHDNCRETLESVAAGVRKSGGTAYVMDVEEPNGGNFSGMFDRGKDYAALLTETEQARSALSVDTLQDTLKKTRKLRKLFDTIVSTDFIPGDAQRQMDTILRELELACARTRSPDEPQAMAAAVGKLRLSDYQDRVWATRQHPWVDRLASAWLIRRFIDPHAEIRWLTHPADCPFDAIGFDFDGATFSHVDQRVTFEVLVASFDLQQTAFTRLGFLVHYLDVGGLQPVEALGIESVLAGLQATILEDDLLLAAATQVFDGLFTLFENQT